MARAGVDIQESIFELGRADQRLAVLCDSVYFIVARVDVVVVPEADLYQGVVVDRIYKIFQDLQDLLILKNPVNRV